MNKLDDKEINEKLAEAMGFTDMSLHDESVTGFRRKAKFTPSYVSTFSYKDPAVFAENVSTLVNLYFSVNFFKNGNQWGVDCAGWENQPPINISQCICKEEAIALARIAASESPELLND